MKGTISAKRMQIVLLSAFVFSSLAVMAQSSYPVVAADQYFTVEDGGCQ